MKVQLIKFHPGQQKIVNEFVLDDSKKFGIVCVGRQYGKSLMAMNIMIGWMMANPNATGGWITPFAKHWMKAFQDIRGACPSLIATSNRTEGEIVFTNGSRLRFMSTENPNGLRGFTFTHVIVDEAGFVKNEAYNILTPTWGVQGKKVLFISTPGIKNWFWDEFQEGWDENIKDKISFRATSYDSPFYPDSEIEAHKRRMPEEQFRQEFLAEFSEAAGGVFFGFDELMSVDEYVSSYEDPCYLGVDIALGGKDRTVCCVMNGAGEIIFMDSWQESITEKQINKIREICERFNIHRGYIEMNQERGIQQAISRYFPKVRAWETTRKSKPPMIQNLKKDIEDGLLALPTRTLEPRFFGEFSNFTYEKKADGYIKYGHPDGGHDDFVIATALANEARVPRRNAGSFLEQFNKINGL